MAQSHARCRVTSPFQRWCNIPHEIFEKWGHRLLKLERANSFFFFGAQRKNSSFPTMWGLHCTILHPVIPNSFSMGECSVVTCAECHRPATHYAPNVRVGPWHSTNWLFNPAWLEWLVCNLLFVRHAVRHAIFDSCYATNPLFCRSCAEQTQRSSPVGAVRALLIIFKTFAEFI